MANVNHRKNNELDDEIPVFTSRISTNVAKKKVEMSTTGAIILEMGLILSRYTISMINCDKLIIIRARFKANRAPITGVHGTGPRLVWRQLHHLKGKNSAKITVGTYIRTVD